MRNDLRQCARISKDYSIAYTPLVNLQCIDENLKEARLCNISAGGIAFEAHEGCKKGDHFVLKISFQGWKKDGAKIVPCDTSESCFSLNAITEIVRVKKVPSTGMFRIAGRFTGRLY